MTLPGKAPQMQAHDAMEGANPNHICSCGGDIRNATNEETARVVSGRVGRIRKGPIPPLDVGLAVFDMGEQVLSCPGNPGS